LSVVLINNDYVKVLDKQFGEYFVDLKCLSPKTYFGLHPKRRLLNKLTKAKEKYLNTEHNGLLIKDIFYGPDEGYKNRSFYLKCVSVTCAHEQILTYASLTRHKKTFGCGLCNKALHGQRIKIDGVLKKRTRTYIHWVTHNSKLPKLYQDSFVLFLNDAGEKPLGKCELVFLEGKPSWISSISSEDKELNLMATALRQAFRHSKFYKDCLKAAKVETATVTKYRCAHCLELFTLSQIQVDHITPVSDITGNPLTKDTLVDRIWTDKIQILDLKCHFKKSALENKERRRFKKEKKNELK
jgi:5-methylcytosine-specific restriction endonuclease McrA